MLYVIVRVPGVGKVYCGIRGLGKISFRSGPRLAIALEDRLRISGPCVVGVTIVPSDTWCFTNSTGSSSSGCRTEV